MAKAYSATAKLFSFIASSTSRGAKRGVAAAASTSLLLLPVAAVVVVLQGGLGLEELELETDEYFAMSCIRSAQFDRNAMRTCFEFSFIALVLTLPLLSSVAISATSSPAADRK
eukprot:GHVU01122156.1.p3 GENE.GHVU01122156.1~~GHVU01122156.1.p3  ORF type:complete len:114 (-),score=18.69 GHVU01122156.1:1104-1445(-)